MINKSKVTDAIMLTARYLLSLIVVLCAAAVLIRMQQESPQNALTALYKGIFGSKAALGNAIRWITPCILTGAAAMVAFRSGVVNLGIEGQMYAGAMTAALIGYYCPMPAPLHVFVCIALGALVGMTIAAIPAVIKYFLNINEMITTLMLNYIVSLVGEYIVVVVKANSTGNATKAMSTPPVADTARLFNIVDKTNASSAVFIAIIVIIALYIVYRYTIVGYEMKQVGANRRFSIIGGVRVTKMFFGIFLLSGMIAGLAGACEITGAYGKYMPGFSDNIGWDGIMISMLANNNPLGVLAVATAWGALKCGALNMELMTNTNRLTVELIQAMYVILVTINPYVFVYLFHKINLKSKFKKEKAD